MIILQKRAFLEQQQQPLDENCAAAKTRVLIDPKRQKKAGAGGDVIGAGKEAAARTRLTDIQNLPRAGDNAGKGRAAVAVVPPMVKGESVDGRSRVCTW